MKQEFEKNRLDLAYQRQLHHLNAVLALGTVGIITFIGTFIWNKELLLLGFTLLIIIFLISHVWYKNINNNLKKISEKIGNL